MLVEGCGAASMARGLGPLQVTGSLVRRRSAPNGSYVCGSQIFIFGKAPGSWTSIHIDRQGTEILFRTTETRGS